MNDLRNWQQFMGNLGRDPELKKLPSGTDKATFSIAINQRRKGDDGNYEDRKPMWVDITAFGNTARLVKRILRKGAFVLVRTSLQIRRVEVDGRTLRYHNYVLREFEVLRWPERTESYDDDDYEYEDDEYVDNEYEDDDFPF